MVFQARIQTKVWEGGLSDETQHRSNEGLMGVCSSRSRGGGVQGVRTPPFVPRCRLFNIGPKIGPPSAPPFLLVDLIYKADFFSDNF